MSSYAGAGSRKITRTIPREVAIRIANRLSAMLGTAEGSSWSRGNLWHTESSWRYRTDDGSLWALLGHGRTRKMVTLTSAEGAATSILNIWIAPEARA